MSLVGQSDAGTLIVAPRIHTAVEGSLKGNTAVVGKEQVLPGAQQTNKSKKTNVRIDLFQI